MNLINTTKKGIPVAPLMGFPGIQLSKTNIKENLENVNLQFKSLDLLYSKYHPDIMFPMMDLSIEAEALGCKIRKARDSSFTVIEHPLKNMADIKNYRVPAPNKSARMPIMLDVINMMSEKLSCINIAYVTGPFTLAALLNGASELIKNVIKEPDFLNKLLTFVTEVIEKYGRALIDAGADGICILEPTTTGLSPEQFWQFSGRFIKQLKNLWDVPVIVHICGDASILVPKMVMTGCECMSFDSMVDIADLIKKIPEDVLVMGNIDPVNVIAYGEKKDVERSVKILLDKMRGYSNFILSTGCDLPPDTNLENIECFINLSRRYNTVQEDKE